MRNLAMCPVNCKWYYIEVRERSIFLGVAATIARSWKQISHEKHFVYSWRHRWHVLYVSFGRRSLVEYQFHANVRLNLLDLTDSSCFDLVVDGWKSVEYPCVTIVSLFIKIQERGLSALDATNEWQKYTRFN